MFRLSLTRRILGATDHRIRATVILMGVLPMAGCGRPLAETECEALLLRYVSLLAVSDRPDSSATERVHMQDLAKQKAALDPQFGKCGKSVSRAQFNCAMVAPSTDEFERCLM
jgi:hypothetical protein